jgi:putative SOS response-associated peptidase YedK
MCGRFSLTHKPDIVADTFSLVDVEPFPARYNIAPTQPILIVRDAPERQGGNRPRRAAQLVRWGFIPGWAKDPKTLPLLFNARSETAAEKASFRGAMRYRRGLVPASGFYEWRKQPKGKGQAFHLRPRRPGPVAFAALFETYLAPDGSEIDTAAILTTAANAVLAPIHDRMPVVVRPEDFGRWLDCRENAPADVANLLQPAAEDVFEAIPIGEGINKVANVGPDVQEPMNTGPTPAITSAAQGSLF